MYKKIEGGTKVHVQGLDCWIPPEGYVYNPMTRRMEYVGVHKRSNKAADCYWEPDKRWSQYKFWQKEELKQQRNDPEYKHPELQKFIADMWLCRLGGHWFSKNGVPTYITGTFWFYLSCFHMTNGLPDYREQDREFLYFWQYCLEDPECYGVNIITRRRYGKTSLSGAIALDLTTRQSQFNTGIQSKTDKDAKEVFKKAIVFPFKKLPYFFQPTSRLPKGDGLPSTELLLDSGKMADDIDELESNISYKSSGIYSYDGYRLGLYIGDETGKSDLDVYERYNVIKYCLKDHNGNVIGMALHTTTVEDMGVDNDSFQQLWKDSKLDKDGQTVTGLRNFFVPSYKGRKPDKYGDCDEEKNKQEILAEREKQKDNMRKLSQLIRKEPFDEEEAFKLDSSVCAFNSIMLNDRLSELTWIPEQFKRGNFHWRSGVFGGEVYFDENPNGRFMVMELPTPDRANAQIERSGKYYPGNTDMYCGGIDPYDHKFTQVNNEKYLSLAAIAILRNFNTMNPSEYAGAPVCIYLCRPDSPYIFYEDALKCLKYYGCWAIIERNKPNLGQYLEEYGYEGYNVMLPGETKRGIYNGGQSNVNTELSGLLDQFVTDSIGKVFFPDLIKQLLRFNAADTTKFDLCMAVGYALMLYRNSRVQLSRQIATTDIGDYLSFMRNG